MFKQLIAALWLVVAAAAPAMAQKHYTISQDALRVTIDHVTGRVLNVTDGDVVLIHDVCDQYGEHDERSDTAVSTTRRGDAIVIECTNPNLPGLSIRKIYAIHDRVLSKKVRFQSDGEVQLLRLWSNVTLDPTTRAGGQYYEPMDTGYEVSRYDIYRPATDVTGDVTLHRHDSGFMAMYQPQLNCTVAQYRIRIDGKISGPIFWSTDNGAWTKDGWRVSLTSAFVGRDRPAIEVEQHIAVVEGDPRKLHQRIFDEPEYQAWFNNPAPDWVVDVQLDGMESTFKPYRQADPHWWIHKMLPLQAKLVADGQHLIVILSDWCNVGYYPHQGPVFYRVGGEAHYTGEITPAQVKATVDYLHAMSPKIKVALYTLPASIVTEFPGQWEGDIKDVHPNWIMYNRDGTPQRGEPACYRTNMADPEYQQVLLDQFEKLVDYYGADLFYLDYGGLDDVDWNPRNPHVVTQADCAAFLQQVHKLAGEKGVAVWTNGMTTPALASDIGIFEMGPQHWEPAYETDWRRFAGAWSLARMIKAHRPSARFELMYPGFIPYYNAVAAYGMLGMGVNQTRSMTQVTARLAYERVGNLLRNAAQADVRVTPDWWRLETTDLETAVLKQGDAHILPVIWHGEKIAWERMTISTADMRCSADHLLFAWASHVAMPYYRDVYRRVPWQETVVTLDGFQVIEIEAENVEFELSLAKDDVHHLVLTQSPGFVYSINGQRCDLLLPDAGFVRVSGAVQRGATQYEARIESRADKAEVLLVVPRGWPGASVGQTVRFREHLFVRVEVSKGSHTIVVERTERKPEADQLIDSTMQSWEAIAQFIMPMTGDLQTRVIREDLRNGLEIRGKAGSLMLTSYALHAMPKLNPDGVSFALRGRGVSGDQLTVVIGNNQWRHTIDAGFTGWREFNLKRDDFEPRGTWDSVVYVTFEVTHADTTPPTGLAIADFHFIAPSRGAPPLDARLTPQQSAEPFRTWSHSKDD